MSDQVPVLAGQNDDTWEHAHGAEEDSRQHHYSLSHQDEVGDDELTFSWEDLPELELKLGRMSWEEEDSDSDDSSMNYWAADETDEQAFSPDDSTQLTAGDDTDQHHSWDISAVSPDPAVRHWNPDLSSHVARSPPLVATEVVPNIWCRK